MPKGDCFLTEEVWRDERTKLIWSSQIGSSWCRASGNTQLAPVTYLRSYNTAVGTPITGNGTIENIVGGSSSISETITITFTSATTFTVSGTGGAGGCQGGATANALTTTAGTIATYSNAGRCSFKITQGVVNFANNDNIIISSALAQTGVGTTCKPGAHPRQPAVPISYCAENAGFDSAAIGENWGAGIYLAAKGRLGSNSVPSVSWRLPTINDYKLADVNGIRFVLPDMGRPGNQRPTIDASQGAISKDWSATLVSDDRSKAYYFDGLDGNVGNYSRTDLAPDGRCVGH